MTRLSWSIKRSLQTYVIEQAGGSVTTAGGAWAEPDFVYAFPLESGSELPRTPSDPPLRFRGSVVVHGHGGMLHLPISDPWVERRESVHVISIVDPDNHAQRLDFVTVQDFVEQELGLVGSGTRMTTDGSDLIFGPYNAGTEFDPPVIHP